MYRHVIKLVLDRVMALCFLTILCWLYLIVAVAIFINLGTPIIFVQERPGRIDPKTGKEKIFKLYKFRSMTNKRGDNGILLSDSERLTRFGRFLRATSLDELPEIFNILKGDMSFVGPRPLLVEYLPRYTAEQRRRHEVLPGLTGYAQVRGRNLVPWEKRFIDDTWYVDHVSFHLDAYIIVKTVGVVLSRVGINSETSETMEEFIGNDSKKVQ